jgi:uncharacterized protein (TIGR04255 family)
MGTKLKNAPVYFTVAQVRFNPILTLESYVPKIQEYLRKHKYPDARKNVLTTINLPTAASASESNPQVLAVPSPRFLFSNMERTSGFILDVNAVTFQTTRYDSFEKFSENFLLGLEAVHNEVKLDFVDRVGMRYLDAVFPRNGETLRDYIAESVLGIAEKLEGDLVYTFSETLVRKGGINILARAIVQNGPVGFPPDLLPNDFGLDEKFSKLHGLHATLDIDGSTDQRELFSKEMVQNRIHAIHGEIEKAFHATITKNAFEIWG